MSVESATAQRGRVGMTSAPAVLREHGVLIALVAVCVLFTATTESFLTTGNLRVLAQNAALPALIACGVTVGILAGQFDLSVGGIYGFAAVIGAVVGNELGLAAAVVAGTLSGVGIGAVNGLLVARVGIQSFLVTLATGFIVLGLGLVVTGGTGTWAIARYDDFARLAQGTLGSLQYRVWIVLAVFAVGALVLARTRPGRQVYAVGGSPVAARVAGVRTRVVVFATFLVSGGCAALAGVIGATDTGVAQSDGGLGMEFTAITAVIVGGTSILGGRGGVWRTLVGVLLLAVIANGFTLLYIDPIYNSLVQGVIILAAITFEARLKGVGPG
jgi:ribose transport system permease protein